MEEESWLHASQYIYITRVLAGTLWEGWGNSCRGRNRVSAPATAPPGTPSPRDPKSDPTLAFSHLSRRLTPTLAESVRVLELLAINLNCIYTIKPCSSHGSSPPRLGSTGEFHIDSEHTPKSLQKMRTTIQTTPPPLLPPLHLTHR